MIIQVNESQKSILYDKLLRFLGSELTGKVISHWGLSFKPNTDDMREAPSLVLIRLLLTAGAVVRVYDPVAMHEAREAIERTMSDLPIERISYSCDIYDAALDAEALLLVTEWKEFRLPSWSVIKRTMQRPLVIDGRNIYERKELEELGFEYDSIGR